MRKLATTADIAKLYGIPRRTANYWARHDSQELPEPIGVTGSGARIYDLKQVETKAAVFLSERFK